MRAIEDFREKYPESPGVILFTERKTILRDLFLDPEGRVCEEKVRRWREAGILDLSAWNVVAPVIQKNRDWAAGCKRMEGKPYLLLINRAFLVSKGANGTARLRSQH